MTSRSRRKHRTTAPKAILKGTLVALLAVSFTLPPSLDSTFAIEAESRESETDSKVERGQWLRRSQPTWINNPPAATALRESDMLQWGPNAQPVALDAPRVAEKPANLTTSIMSAKKVPANIANENSAEPKIPKSLQLVLGPATGNPDQTYRGVRVLEPNHATESDAQESETPRRPPVHVAGYSVASDEQTQSLRPQRRAESKKEALRQQAQLCQQRARRVVAEAPTSINPLFEKPTPELVLVAEPTPPQQSFFEPMTSFYSFIEQSDYQVPAESPPATHYFAVGSQPAPATEKPTFTVPEIENSTSQPQLPDYSEVMEDLQRVPPQTQPDAASDPFQANDLTDDPAQANDPFQPAPSRVNDNQFEELFTQPTDSETDDELDSELQRLEDQSDRDDDIQRDLRDLGLDDEPTDDDVEDELPSRRVDEDRDDAAADCARIYEDRNCCDEDAECERAFTRLRNYTISTLSLNASPLFDPSEEDPVELRRLQMEKLAEAPARQWMDRNGTIVADGRLEDYVEGKVHVRNSIDGGIVKLDYRNLSRDDLCFVNAWWGLPAECSLGDEPLQIRNWTMTTFTWKASGVCHKPLYFQHLELERYGHSAGPVLQPVLSGAHFFANVILLPYNCGLHPPTECLYDLGDYRPGDCAPWLIPAVPLHHRAALYQTAFGLGLWGIF